jgi:DNA-binding MarR family transcriptional regulator
MDSRGVNLVATLAAGLADAVGAAVVEVAGIAGAAPAALAVLLAEPGIGVDGLARTLGLTGSGAVRLVDRLTAAGLVERRPGRDARTVSVWPTPAGRRAGRDVLDRREAAASLILDALPAEDRAHLVRIAEMLLARMTTDRDGAERLCRLCDTQACPGDRCPVEQAVP